MIARKNLVIPAAFAVAIAAAGCSVKTTAPANGTAPSPDAGRGSDAKTGNASRPKTTPKTSTLKAKAGATPPAGAKSLGAQTQPAVGAVTVPITDVEVYSFEEKVADDLPPEIVNWAYVEGVGNYLWVNGSVTCSDGSVDTGAGFLMVVKEDGAGTYLFSLPGCPSGDLFGCDFDSDGNDTTCGACVVEGEQLVCDVASNE